MMVFILNNYRIAKVKKFPKDKIKMSKRLDPYHTLVVFEGLTVLEEGLARRYFGTPKDPSLVEGLILEG